MPANTAKLTSIVAEYLSELRRLRAYWRNTPSNVWAYKLGGYQVLKKWLSHRESKVLARPLKPDEVQHFAEVARRLAAILDLASRVERHG